MVRHDDLRTTADALADSVVVCGVGRYDALLSDASFSRARYSPLASLPEHLSDATAAVVVGVDATAYGDVRTVRDALEALGDDPTSNAFTVAVLACDAIDAETLAAVRRHVDALLLVGGPDADGRAGGDTSDGGTEGEPADPVEQGIRELLAAVQRPGFVNLDLTDARTVLSAGVAALGSGTAGRDAPATAVEAAFDRLPRGVDVDDATAVLVDVVVDPVTSITAATDAIGAVRDRIDGDANVIWGGAVDESIGESVDDGGTVDGEAAAGEAADGESPAGEIAVRVVVADVRYAPPLDAGDPCPRCATPLSTYEFGARTTLSCDGCGFSGIAVRRD